MGVIINIYENKIIVYDTRNSIVYYKYMAQKFSDYYHFKSLIESYTLAPGEYSFVDVLDLAARNRMIAMCHRETKPSEA